MTNLQWLDEYNIGNEIIDKQHRYLFDLANQMLDPYNDYQSTHHKFLVLDHFLKEHFDEEEKLMAEYNFSEINQHKKAHKLLLAELDEISQEIVRGEMDKDKILEFMRHWLFDHFLKMDMSLKHF
ncbi:MAG: bacteriohemerythrin [Gammaproteobacteria bacterium]